ncbi:hypothetical protein ACIHCQ_20245 [Streptomyces sp. NPDC052236]|uniref:hypothetical protein n=1 Tax=Streptomyces sp. NPDC052236 TaxID=3365686 RepID=UPI0037D3B7AF
MARVVCVHGVGKQYLGEELLLREWLPALHDGLTRAGRSAPLSDADVGMAFYGDLFRPPGHTMDVADPPFTAQDVEEGLEEEILLAWWAEAAAVDERVPPPGANTMARVPSRVQAALLALASSSFFSGLALRSLLYDLKQVSRYLLEPGTPDRESLREQVQSRLRALIGPDTRVVIAHSLGSIAAYETLCSLARSAGGHHVRAFVTLGSPLGIPRLILDHLQPVRDTGKVQWPGSAAGFQWTNVVDQGDVVALRKNLHTVFGQPLGQVVHGRVVHNGSHAHDATAYLCDAMTGTAIAGGLDG